MTMPPQRGPAEALLDVHDLHVTIRPNRHAPAVEPVRGLSLSVPVAGRVALVGESGSGKSLTALSLMGLLPGWAHVSAGSLRLSGEELSGATESRWRQLRGGTVAMVYQDPLSSLNPVQQVGRQIMEAVQAHERVPASEARRRMLDALADVGIPDPHRRALAYPHQLSGGLRQRVVIAMAIVTGPALLVADEPTTALDVTTQARVLDLLLELSVERRMALLLITHDLAVAATACDEAVVMYAGRAVERAPMSTLLERPAHPYSGALLAASCDLDADLDVPIRAIAGQPPTPAEVRTGCSFEPRCPYASSTCTTTAPSPRRVDESVVECHRADDPEVRADEGSWIHAG